MKKIAQMIYSMHLSLVGDQEKYQKKFKNIVKDFEKTLSIEQTKKWNEIIVELGDLEEERMVALLEFMLHYLDDYELV